MLMVLLLEGKIVMTPHGFILDADKALKSYKEEHKEAWKKILGGVDFIIAEEEQAYTDIRSHIDEPQSIMDKKDLLKLLDNV